MLPIAILAGGFATRLNPITETIPKSLVEIAGDPFIVHQLRNIERQGIQDVVLCVGHLGEQIEDFVQDGSQFGVRVKYSYEINNLLGTGGAIRNALHLLSKKFFVLYGDSLLEIDYKSVYESFLESDCYGLMTVFKNKGKWDISNVEMTNSRIKEYRKKNPSPRMTHIDYGLGILMKNLFEAYPEGSTFDLAEIYESLADSGRLASFEAKNRFFEIGSHVGLKELNDLMKKGKRHKL